jgi:hypothetical protein
VNAQRVSVTLDDDEAAKLEKLCGSRFPGVEVSRSGTAAFLMRLGMCFYETAERGGAGQEQIYAWLNGEPFGPEAVLRGSSWRDEVGRETVESLREAAGILSRVARVEQLRQGERAIKSIMARARLHSVPPLDVPPDDGAAGLSE